MGSPSRDDDDERRADLRMIERRLGELERRLSRCDPGWLSDLRAEVARDRRAARALAGRPDGAFDRALAALRARYRVVGKLAAALEELPDWQSPLHFVAPLGAFPNSNDYLRVG